MPAQPMPFHPMLHTREHAKRMNHSLKINSLLGGDADRRPSSFNQVGRLPALIVRILVVSVIGFLGLAAMGHAAEPPSYQLEELTWQEVRDRVATGSTTILVPIGGTEQNGPYMVLGKHNARVKFLANAIAQRLGNALVAPVMAYVPEGSIHPPAAHMRFMGTISISESAFESVLESTARSFKQHGFRDVVFLGDHGGYQKNEQRVENRLNHEWSNDPACRVHALLDFYKVTQSAYVATLKSRGFSDAEIGTHAGLADTSLALAVDRSLVHADALTQAPQPGPRDGVYGDPRKATKELGQLGIEQIVQTSVSSIQALTRMPR
jgi:creatinine amidohydrolase